MLPGNCSAWLLVRSGPRPYITLLVPHPLCFLLVRSGLRPYTALIVCVCVCSCLSVPPPCPALPNPNALQQHPSLSQPNFLFLAMELIELAVVPKPGDEELMELVELADGN